MNPEKVCAVRAGLPGWAVSVYRFIIERFRGKASARGGVPEPENSI